MSKILDKLFGKSDKKPADKPKAVLARVVIVEPDETYITVKLEPVPGEYITTPTLHLNDPSASCEDYRSLYHLYSACGERTIPKDDIVSRELLLEHMRHKLVGRCLWVDGGKRS